jgi:putative phosphoribosyl transferase
MSGGGGPEGGRAGEEVRIGPMGLEGRLTPPGPGRGIVLFAHGSGSGRLSPRNNLVARGLGRAGLGTLLFDLLTPDEAADRRNVFDIDLLARRLVLATGWLRDRADTRAAPPVGAVVSRGGRPDLAREGLRRVRAPVLLIVGGLDGHVLALNRQALAALPGVKRLAIVEGAGHLFEEPGTLERVVGLARAWFATHLAAPGPP